MKQIILLMLVVFGLNASGLKLYKNAEGQVFVTPANGRELIENSSPTLDAKASKLKFSGLTYIGYRFDDKEKNESNFEIRRSYFQLKSYFLDDEKSYFRLTLDMHQNTEDDMVIRAKYVYLFIDKILPKTGIEIGLTHRPWHDYEEHNAWFYRNISKVVIEAKNAGNLSNSADFGFNFKTKTKYFDSEFGIFNGEGYHSDQNDDEPNAGKGISFEWRTTAHLLGVNGKDKQTTKRYLDLSFFGQYNQEHKIVDSNAEKKKFDDLIFMGVHTVYNQPSFLISAQHIISEDTAQDSTYISSQAGSGSSVNAEYRFGHDYKYRIISRYDTWTNKKINTEDEKENKSYIIGGVWEQNKNTQWVINTITTNNESGSLRESENGTSYMVTAEVTF